MVSYGLKDRVALITGANNPQGIGATPSVRIFLLYNKRLHRNAGARCGENEIRTRGTLIRFVGLANRYHLIISYLTKPPQSIFQGTF